MQASCKQSDAFNQRKEDVGNYSVKVKHITQTQKKYQRSPAEARFASSFANCLSLTGAHWTTRNISRIELTIRFFFPPSKQLLWEEWKDFLMCIWILKGFLYGNFKSSLFVCIWRGYGLKMWVKLHFFGNNFQNFHEFFLNQF